MAGMVPGVESVRRRRFHHKSNSPSSPAATAFRRRSSLSLYVSSHEFNLLTSNFSTRNEVMCDERRLGVEAREAKKRLDEKLQPHWRKKTDTEERVKKSGSKRLKWLKLSWRSKEEEECVVCLEQINGGGSAPETLMQLPCRHRFHTHCPCCRMEIPSS